MKKAILILLFILISAYPCFAKENARREVKRGNALYDEGKFKESLKHYEKASSAKPNSGIVNYNIGTASYKLNDYQRAADSFNRALVEEKDELSQQTSYNLANSEYMLGITKENSNLDEAIALLTESLRHYEKALELDKEDKDAIFNYEYVKKELKRLREKKKQQQKQQQKQQKKEEQKQEKKDKKEGQEKQKQDQQEQEEQEKEKEKQQEQQEQEEQDKEKEKQQEQQESQDKEPQQQEPQQEEPRDEMSDKQASMLLDNYHNDEEPKGLYKQLIKTSSMPDVDKDW